MEMPPTRRIILLGKPGAGKSSLGNTIFGETVFKINQWPVSKKSICQAESKLIKGRNMTLIDTPGFFDTGTSEDDMKPEIVQCIMESAPGPHAFVLVLKLEQVTDKEKDAISKMCQCFSEEAFKYAVILFTHGDQLPEGIKIQEFIGQSEGLTNLVKKCGGRCHVIDNKYWNREPQKEYRNNQFQVEELLDTIEKMVKDNKGGYFTNELLQAVETEIHEEEERIRQEGNACQKETREKTKTAVYKKNVAKFAHITGKGLIMGALLGSEVAILFASVKGVNAIRQAVTKEKPGIEKTANEATAAVEEQAAATPGKQALTAVVKGAEIAKTAANVISLAKVLGGKDAAAEETGDGEVVPLEGETQGPMVGASTGDTAMGSAATEIAAAEEIGVAAREGALEDVSAAGETFRAAAEESAAEAAFAVEEAVDGVAEGTAAVTTAAEGLAEASLEGAVEMAAAVGGAAEGSDAMETIVAVAEAAAEACCIQ